MSAHVHSVEIDHVTKQFRRHHDRATSLKQFVTGGRRRNYDDFTALDDVSFNVRRGEVFGVIGHNGSGKSTMLKCMAGILRPTSGTVRVHDRMSALLELGAGFHPELTGRENVFLNAALLGMRRHEIAERYDQIVEFSGLDDEFLDTPVKTYSSGMYVRLAFSIAINVEPDLLIIDEILAVGDIDFQRKCTERFLEFRNSGRTTVLVTHDLGSVRTMCDRAVWLDHGKLRGTGNPGEIVDGYTESMSGATDRVAALGTYREGSGEIQFTDVTMSVDGQPTARVRTGDDVDVHLALRRHVTDREPGGVGHDQHRSRAQPQRSQHTRRRHRPRHRHVRRRDPVALARSRPAPRRVPPALLDQRHPPSAPVRPRPHRGRLRRDGRRPARGARRRHPPPPVDPHQLNFRWPLSSR